MISSEQNDLYELSYLGQGHQVQINIELQDALCPSGAFKTSKFFSLEIMNYILPYEEHTVKYLGPSRKGGGGFVQVSWFRSRFRCCCS